MMNSNWHRGPLGPIQGLLGVLCWGILSSTAGCGTENQSNIEGAGAGSERATDTTNGAVPWGPGEDCSNWGCKENAASQSAVAPPKNAQTCSAGSECSSGFCVDGVCCDSACTGLCQACTAAKKGQGADGTCGVIALYGDPDNECYQGACDGTGKCQKYNGATCGGTTECLSGYCADGYCCGTVCSGTCVACAASKKASGPNGQCGAIAANTDPDNECANGDCNGSGACTVAGAGLGAQCNASSQCSSGNCVDGVCCDTACTGSCQACSAAKKFQGTDGTCGPIASTKNPDGECQGGYCNGSGACIFYNGVACTGVSQCMSGYCVDGVCCNNVCTSTCQACTIAKKGSGYNGQCGPIAAGTDPDNECVNGDCSGTLACTAPVGLGNGQACTGNSQCSSGFCADGVCCDTACTGSCQACSAAKKFQGTDGTCGPIASTKNPDGECQGGYCNGTGACIYYNGVPCTSVAQCMSGYCADGVCCGNICNGPCVACTAAKRGGGVNGQCGAIATNTDPDNECLAEGVCNGSGACINLGNGASCTSGSSCSSGFCVDGVCCNSACTGTCMTCNATGLAGTCSPTPVGQGDTNSSPACGSCDGAGHCLLTNGSACTAGSQCASRVCDDKLCAAVTAPAAPFLWATILSPTTSSTIDIDWLTPTTNGGLSGNGSKTGVIDLNGWVLGSGPAYSEPWSFQFDASGAPTAISDSAANDADNDTVYYFARARYFDIVGVSHWYHGNGNSVYTSTVTATAWNRTYDNTEITALSAGDGGHVLLAATVTPDSVNGVDFGDGELVTGNRLVKYDPTGAVVFNYAAGTQLGAILDRNGNFYDISRQTTAVTINKQDGLGNAVWTKSVPMTLGTGATSTITSVFDETGNLILAFNFNGSVDFGNGAMTATGIDDLGLAKLDSSGAPIWTKHFGTATFNLTNVFMDYTSTDAMAVVGYFSGTADLGAGSFTGGRFLAKFDNTGTLVWRSMPPTGYYYALTGAPSGSVFIATTAPTTDFGWGAPLAGTGGLAIAKYGN